MIFPKYPGLIQREILDDMNNLDLLLLSLVSKNMKKLVSSSQNKRFRNIRSIEYEYDRTDGTCVVYLLDQSKPLKEYYKQESRTVDDIIIRIEHTKAGKDSNQLNVSGKLIDLRLSDDYKYPVASYLEYDKESVFQSIHNHFLDVFGNSIEYNWEEPSWGQSKEFFIPFIPKLKNVSFCIGLYLDEQFSDVRNFENFFSLSPVAKLIQMKVHKKMKPLNPESKFYQAESIYIHTWKINGPDFVRHFRGRQISVDCDRYEKENVIDFVKRWKSGEAFQNLEFLNINPRGDNQFPPRLLIEIGAKFIDGNKQPPKFDVRQRFDWYDKDTTVYLPPSYAYVVRKTDNRVASVEVQYGTFFIGVWAETEEEFLKMIK
ncbi:unnamed protein product [Caenorhabditis nigoni]